jgi:hypothetical protein
MYSLYCTLYTINLYAIFRIVKHFFDYKLDFITFYWSHFLIFIQLTYNQMVLYHLHATKWGPGSKTRKTYAKQFGHKESREFHD